MLLSFQSTFRWTFFSAYNIQLYRKILFDINQIEKIKFRRVNLNLHLIIQHIYNVI